MKLHNKSEHDQLWSWLFAQKNQWWRGGREYGPKFGWADIYEADNWHCVYCGRDLAESEDVLAESTEEHLVPASFLSLYKQNANFENNVVAACAGCNGLKGPVMPMKGDPAWSSRKAYIASMRDFVDKARAARAEKYRKHAFHARARRIWDRKTAREADYLKT